MPQDQGSSDSGAAKRRDADGFRTPLPLGGAESALGPAKDWPETLKAYSLTIASFPYPAAVFYGEEMVTFHNQAWADVAGVDEQGQKQRGRLKADAWEALSSALSGGKPKNVDATQLLGKGASGSVTSDTYKPVLISPLFDTEGGDAVGLLAQLILQNPGSPSHGSNNQSADTPTPSLVEHPSPKDRQLDISELGNVSDFPLDEHPVFYRFAEMLPSGLAILDHKAQAVFVNQLFYQLTTHQRSDKAFQSWPQSIHPEDYERVMSAYEEAFSSQKQ